MIEKIEYRGTWFVPGEAQDALTGILIFIPGEQPVLSLDGVFGDFPGFGDGFITQERPKIILGTTSQGRYITLFRCFRRSASFGTLSPKSTYTVDILIDGSHFLREDDIKFNRVMFGLSNLNEWFETRGLVHGTNKHGFDINYSDMGSKIIYQSDAEKVFVDERWLGRANSHKVDISISTSIIVEFSEKLFIDESLRFISSIQDFLGIAMGELPFTTWISSWVDYDKTKTINKSTKIIFNPILSYNPNAKERNAFKMLFTLSKVEDRIAMLIGNWIRREKELQPIYDLYFSNLRSSFGYTENRFLNYTQALETYHRKVFGGKYVDNDTYSEGLYKILIDALPKELEPEFRESLVKGKLKYANEYSLRKRINDILKSYSLSLPNGILDNRTKRDVFISDVVDNRNYLTHYDDSNMKNVKKGEELFNLSQGVKMLLEITFLVEMGFELEEIKEMIIRSDSYKFFANK